jgi:5-formaminoimidazole-4-carboxamide-1-beta-D-ribofuranosyl 5'-monophosphate synthetase
VAIVGMDERARVEPDQLVVLAAVHPAERRVHLHDEPRVEVIGHQPVAGRLKDPAILLLALKQLLLGARRPLI